MQIEINLVKLERGTHIGRVKVTRGGKTFWRKQRVGIKESQIDKKESWRDKPEGYFKCDRAASVQVVFKPNYKPIASMGFYNGERAILIGKRFFEYSDEDFGEEHESHTMAHETGHIFEYQIENLSEELTGGCAAKVLGTLADPESGIFYDGIWGMENPNEAFAESVAVLYSTPDIFKENHPEAYEFVKSVMPPNWREVIDKNIKSMKDAKEEYMLYYKD